MHLRAGGEIIEIVEKFFQFRPRNANRIFKVRDGKAVQDFSPDSFALFSRMAASDHFVQIAELDARVDFG